MMTRSLPRSLTTLAARALPAFAARTLPSLLVAAALAAPVALASPAALAAQGAANEADPWPEANPTDVASLDAILGALYDVISGPAGQARDWDRFRSLFLPEARLIPSGSPPEGEHTYRVLSPGEWAQTAAPVLEQGGFFEVEIARSVDQFGPVVHAFSTYESRRNADDPEPYARGINSIQLMDDGDRWHVVTIYWIGEGPDLPIPRAYLP